MWFTWEKDHAKQPVSRLRRETFLFLTQSLNQWCNLYTVHILVAGNRRCARVADAMQGNE